MIELGKKSPIKTSDMYMLPSDMKAEAIYLEFLQCWAMEDANAPLRLWKSMYRLIKKEFMIAGLMVFINSLSVLLAPVLLKWIVQANSNSNSVAIFFLACCITTNSIIGAIAVQQFIHGVFMTGSKVVSAGTSVVFYSTLCLRMHRMHPPKSVGEINNIQSKDSASLREFVVFAHNLWSCPLLVLVSVIMLVYLLGFAGLVTAVLLPTLIPIESYISKKSKIARKAMLVQSDKRMQLVNELIDGIKTVKLTSLIPLIYSKIMKLRDAELDKAWYGSLIEMANSVITSSSSLIITLVTFGVYSALSPLPLTADKAFATLAVITIIGRPMRVIPKVRGGPVVKLLLG